MMHTLQMKAEQEIYGANSRKLHVKQTRHLSCQSAAAGKQQCKAATCNLRDAYAHNQQSIRCVALQSFADCV